VHTSLEKKESLVMAKRERRFRLLFGLYRILPIPIVYGVWYATEGLGGDRILRNRRAIVMQQCGQCRWGGAEKDD